MGKMGKSAISPSFPSFFDSISYFLFLVYVSYLKREEMGERDRGCRIEDRR